MQGLLKDIPSAALVVQVPESVFNTGAPALCCARCWRQAETAWHKLAARWHDAGEVLPPLSSPKLLATASPTGPAGERGITSAHMPPLPLVIEEDGHGWMRCRRCYWLYRGVPDGDYVGFFRVDGTTQSGHRGEELHRGPRVDLQIVDAAQDEAGVKHDEQESSTSTDAAGTPEATLGQPSGRVEVEPPPLGPPQGPAEASGGAADWTTPGGRVVEQDEDLPSLGEFKAVFDAMAEASSGDGNLSQASLDGLLKWKPGRMTDEGLRGSLLQYLLDGGDEAHGRGCASVDGTALLEAYGAAGEPVGRVMTALHALVADGLVIRLPPAMPWDGEHWALAPASGEGAGAPPQTTEAPGLAAEGLAQESSPSTGQFLDVDWNATSNEIDLLEAAKTIDKRPNAIAETILAFLVKGIRDQAVTDLYAVLEQIPREQLEALPMKRLEEDRALASREFIFGFAFALFTILDQVPEEHQPDPWTTLLTAWEKGSQRAQSELLAALSIPDHK